jgi:membrane-associated phospholipid phosphatase
MRPFLSALALAGSLYSAWPGHGSLALERTGDVLQIALPAGAGWAALALRDWVGFRQFAVMMLVSQGATHLLKHTVQSTRPDGGKNGFPSAHTSSAFAGACFVGFRYGNQYAWPLYLAASVVGYSRLTADKHGPVDVFGGAALSVLSCWGMVRRRRTPSPKAPAFP